MAKIGRNEPCPCGSGKKYKRCHGSLRDLDRVGAALAALPQIHARHQAKEHQRVSQQGLGRPIVATHASSGHQVVAVRNRIFASDKWKTFHDFLIDYLKDALGAEWGTAEMEKPLERRHPILVWYYFLYVQRKEHSRADGGIASANANGATAAFMHLAYDLYALDHNADLQERLILRLRNPELFPGARYEVQVAAMLVRAGFTLEFEDEADRRSSHCEFVATHSRTGKQFSVEAKRAESNRIQRQLVRALRKAANHVRVVFVDLNTPDSGTNTELPGYAQRAFEILRRFEDFDPQAQRLPPAYVFFTNTPWEHHLDNTQWRCVTLGDSLHIQEFKNDHQYESLRAAIEARQAHIEMHDLLKSMRQHVRIPATFDGENPVLAFSSTENRLLVGSRHAVPGPDGVDVEGILTSGVVMEAEKSATCTFRTDHGHTLVIACPLSDVEMAAWRRHPETFFGEVSTQWKCESALDFYDFFLDTYSKTPRKKLLEFLAAAPDIDDLAQLGQTQLASIFSERMAESAFLSSGVNVGPLLQPRWKISSRQDDSSRQDRARHPGQPPNGD